jgi:hypothetical protein
MDLSAFVGKLLEEQDGDVLREGVRVLAQALMETEITALVGAERHERSDERTASRNGTRVRTWDTRVGTVDLAIPKVRPGTYFPSLLQPRRRAEQALLTVVQEAYVHGMSTRKVDDLVKALGLDGISKSEVSRICAELGPVVEAFRTRPLTGEHPYVWLDATYHKVRIDGRVVSQATVVAIGVTLDGERQVLGIDVGASEDRGFWTAFLRSLVKRGLSGVRLVISDAHEGLKQAISTVLSGAAWQRCRVHFMRNLLATVPQAMREPKAYGPAEQRRIGVLYLDSRERGTLPSTAVHAGLAVTQGVLATQTAFGGGPAAALARVNQILIRRATGSRFVTVFFAALAKNGCLTYSNAGHNPPILVSGSTVRRLETGGLICGLFETATYAEETVELQPGDVLLIFSDGISEALNAAGEEFGDDRILECLKCHAQGSVNHMLECLVQTVKAFASDTVQSDDMTAVVVRYRGQGTPPA